jgi:HSP20 family molecular chaperone IbpA
MALFSEPFAPLLELSRELDRFIPGATAPRSFVPAADVVVGANDVMVVVDVPGRSVENIKVELFDGVLRIHGSGPSPTRRRTIAVTGCGWSAGSARSSACCAFPRGWMRSGSPRR